MSDTKLLDVEATLANLNIQEKIALLTGNGWWHTQPIKSNTVNIPSVRMSDGPNGVRGTRFFNGVPSSCFPASTGLGSSFDVALAKKIGEALAEESKAKGVHVLLAPTVNTQRSPLGGRGFESFSEDPQLNGRIAAAYINGLQSKKVAATIKHFVANDQEFERFSISSEVSERALREIYLKPFQIALKESKPWALMTSYNRVNGLHASEDPWLLQDILSKEWGYTGLLMSDWTGTYSTAEPIKAGLDLEMPGPTVVRGQAVLRALQSGKLFPEDVDIRVRKILHLVNHAIESRIPFDAPERSLDNADVRKLLRQASSSSVVLLKNESSLLPIQVSEDNTPKIAVIGPNAGRAFISGGGSASLLPTYTISPLEGIKNVVKELGGDPSKVTYTPGPVTHNFVPLADPYITQPNNANLPGGKLEFWNNSPDRKFLDPSVPGLTLPPAVWDTPAPSAYAFLVDGVDDCVNDICWIRYTTTFTPTMTCKWKFGLSIAGRGCLFIDGRLAIDFSSDAPQGESFFGLGTVEKRAELDFEDGKAYPVELRMANSEFISRPAPFFTRGGLRMGADVCFTDEDAISNAVLSAQDADMAIVVIGLNSDIESEGFDREDMKLPGRTNEMVNAILEAQPKTIIVNQSGTPVEMPWVDRASTLLQAFYGGNDVGQGLADVILGNVNPSAKLPLTFPKRLEDNPSYSSFGVKTQELGKVLYNEGIFVGYRGYEIKKLVPLFPFGYGLSYTSFKYSALNIPCETNDGKFFVKFKIKNTGNHDGAEVAQIYIADQVSSLPRPVKELKGFAKTFVKTGEVEDVQVDLDISALSFWDGRKGVWIAEAGIFDILVAASAQDIKLTGQIKLTETVTYIGL